MMNTKFLPTLFLVISIFLVTSCEKDGPGEDKPKTFSNTEVSEWIYEWMNTIYLWNDKIPQTYNPLNETDPLVFFNKLLYKEEDKWSYATDDYLALNAELNGKPTSKGISPAFGKFRDSDKVFIIVEYVVPGSPSDLAGLKRGDIILSINGTELDTVNYRQLYFRDSFTAGLGSYDGTTISPSGASVSLTAEVITSKPVMHSEVLEYEGKKIGYLVYVDFLSGEEGIFVNQLNAALQSFETAGIDELIVDLRYNPGGEVTMASYLASSIAPSTVASPSNVLVSYIFNDILTEYFLSSGGQNSSNLNLFFMNTAVNLNLNKVYFMTSSGTASASELVITGLDPYMDVVVVGDTTYGKYTGAWVFPDTEEPRRHNYAIIPIVLKYANSIGVTEFKNGLVPDYAVADKLLGAEPFGSLNDPMLAKVLELITGINPLAGAKKSYESPDYTIIPDIDRIRIRSINRETMPQDGLVFSTQNMAE